MGGCRHRAAHQCSCVMRNRFYVMVAFTRYENGLLTLMRRFVGQEKRQITRYRSSSKLQERDQRERDSAKDVEWRNRWCTTVVPASGTWPMALAHAADEF
jgi:hypothetical protein